MPKWFDAMKAALFPSGRNADPNTLYGVAMHSFSPGSPVWTQKNFSAFVREGYKRCGTVYNCVNKISIAAAGIRWRLYTDESMKKEITTHPLLDLWKKPNPRMAGAAFVQNDWGFWHLAGNSYTWAYRPTPESLPLALWLLRPDRVKIVPNVGGEVQSYIYGYGTEAQRTFAPEDVMHTKLPDYDDDHYGMSPLQTAMYLVDQINEGNAWNTALLQNAGKPASVLFTKGYLTTQQRDQIRGELQRRYSGKRNAGMPLILEADMQWQSMSMSPYELDWLQSRELNMREIAAIYDVAPELIGDPQGKTYANVAEARMALYLENILPKMDQKRDHANMWLVPMYPDLKKMGAYFTYDRSDIEALRAMYESAEQTRIGRASSIWLNGGCSLNEYRDLVGLSSLKGDQGNVYRVGQILVLQDDLATYARQSLSQPAAPPKALPEPLNVIDAASPTPQPDPASASEAETDDANSEIDAENEKSLIFHETNALRYEPWHRPKHFQPGMQVRFMPLQSDEKIPDKETYRALLRGNKNGSKVGI